MYWNPEDWTVDDKDWLATRKQEWRYIQHNLKLFSSTTFRGSYLKHHKRLFFEGQVEADILAEHGDYAFEFMLPLFVLWYHPNLNESVVKSVLDTRFESFSHALTLSKCRELINKLWKQSATKFKEEYGFMGGRERPIVEALWGEPLVGAVFDGANPKHPRSTTRLNMVNSYLVANFYWGSVRSVLRNGKKNQYAPGQYLFRHAMAVSDNLEAVSYRIIRRVASSVLFFDDSPITDKENDVSLAKRDAMLESYRNGAFHDEVQRIWDDVKSGNVAFGE